MRSEALKIFRAALVMLNSTRKIVLQVSTSKRKWCLYMVICLAGFVGVRIWHYSVIDQHLLTILHPHNGVVLSLAFSPDGDHLASIGSDSTFVVSNLSTSQSVVFSCTNLVMFTEVAYSVDGRIVAVGLSDGTINLWDMSSKHFTRKLQGFKSGITSLAFSPDNIILASGSGDGIIRLWEIKSGNLLKTLAGHRDTVTSLAFHPDASIMASASFDRTIKTWDMARQIEVGDGISFNEPLLTVAYSPDGDVLMATNRNEIILWDLRKRCELKRWKSSRLECQSAVYCNNTNYVATASGNMTNPIASFLFGGEIAIWRTSDQVCIGRYDNPFGGAKSLASSTDGLRLAVGYSFGDIRLWAVPCPSQ